MDTRSIRRRSTKIDADDLALLGAFESALAADPDFDDGYPAVVKTMRDRIAHARHEQASQN
jgi:hypothetical protein